MVLFAPVADSSPKPEPVRKKKKVELTLREEIEKERNHVAGDPPEVRLKATTGTWAILLNSQILLCYVGSTLYKYLSMMFTMEHS